MFPSSDLRRFDPDLCKLPLTEKKITLAVGEMQLPEVPVAAHVKIPMLLPPNKYIYRKHI